MYNVEETLAETQTEFQVMPVRVRKAILQRGGSGPSGGRGGLNFSSDEEFFSMGSEDDVMTGDLSPPPPQGKGKAHKKKTTSSAAINTGKSAHSVHYAPPNTSAHVLSKPLSNLSHIIPHAIYTRVLDDLKAQPHYSKVTRKPATVTAICKYWALKREAGRGAPLLKRLHLEPWTATASATREDEAMKQARLQVRERDRRRCELLLIPVFLHLSFTSLCFIYAVIWINSVIWLTLSANVSAKS